MKVLRQLRALTLVLGAIYLVMIYRFEDEVFPFFRWTLFPMALRHHAGWVLVPEGPTPAEQAAVDRMNRFPAILHALGKAWDRHKLDEVANQWRILEKEAHPEPGVRYKLLKKSFDFPSPFGPMQTKQRIVGELPLEGRS